MIIKKVRNSYKVESSGGGKYYTINANEKSCDCPAFMFRRRQCKHITAVMDFIDKKGADKKVEAVILNYIANEGEVEAVELIEMYGEEKIDEMIRLGEIVEEKGKVRILK